MAVRKWFLRSLIRTVIDIYIIKNRNENGVDLTQVLITDILRILFFFFFFFWKMLRPSQKHCSHVKPTNKGKIEENRNIGSLAEGRKNKRDKKSPIPKITSVIMCLS